MKKGLLVFFAIAIALVSCKKEEEETTRSGGSSGTGFGYVTTPEGAVFTITHPDGTTESRSSDFVSGWHGGQLLNSNYWKQLIIYDGQESHYLRWNMLADADWEAEVQEEGGLYNFPFLLQYSQDMTGTIVEYYVPFSDDFEGNASGNVEVELDKSILGEVYDVFGSVDATFTVNGLQTHVEGNFWAKDLD
ncbi:MAG: hypothetical protein HRT74_00400 [Flavobacteriales bacterium]|nr:hypothetical protein [Flavobacteriales bacterium]